MAPRAVTFYEELGVPRDATAEDIKQAYKKKALEVHPDKHPEEEKEQWTNEFRRVLEMFQTLSSAPSRMVYDEKHVKMDRTGSVLVLMDMNGSLLYKHAKRDVLMRARPDFADKKHWFYVRPHVGEFLKAVLARDSGISFGIYTSRQSHNALPQVQELFRAAGCGNLYNSLFHVFAGDAFSVPNPEEGRYKSKRSLPKIWNDRNTCARAGVKFDAYNTVNLDNEAAKLKDHRENGLVVPSFAKAEVGQAGDTVLKELAAYLLHLAKHSHGNVQEFLREHPFQGDGAPKLRALPSMSDLEEDEGGVGELSGAFAGLRLSY